MNRQRIGRWAVLAALLSSLLGCAQVEQLPAAQLFGATGPRATVGKVLAAIAAHDLATANGYACDPSVIVDDLPVPLNFRFGTARIPGVSTAEALAVVGFDFSGLEAVERVQDDSQATVEITGPVGLTFDLAAVHDLAVKATNGSDPATVETVMAVLGDGHLTTSMHTTVQLTRDGTRWLICSGSTLGG